MTASIDLPTHVTLSKPFLSRTLTDLVEQSSAMMRHENRSLWKVRHLWTALCGDGNWMPCETMTGPDDLGLYSDDHIALHLLSLNKARGAGAGAGAGSPGEANANGSGARPDVASAREAAREIRGDADAPMADGPGGGGGAAPQEERQGRRPVEGGEESSATKEQRDGEVPGERGSGAAGDEGAGEKKGNHDDNGGKAATTDGSGDVAMKDAGASTTSNGWDAGRRAAAMPAEALEALEALDGAFIHPMFQAPAGAGLDRDLGLPEKEAEDIRRLLALYVQKQEEVCRGATRLHQGLLKAERLRKDVLHWAKAEAHCGANRDLSDGEDWYDKEEWGLTEDLKKGQDEEEEDTTTTGKKTRNRRQ